MIAGLLVLVLLAMHAVHADLPPVEAAAFVGALAALTFAFVDMLVRDVRRTFADPIGERVSVLGIMVVETVLLFAATYLSLGQEPDQIQGLTTPLDAAYFTMTTLLTVGFGDIAAVGQWARAVVLVQMLFSVLLLTSSARLLSSLIRSMTEAAGRREANS